jgi:type IV pilus assembly protein PilA
MKSMKMMKKQAQAGFTLIELMIVVAIIGILAAVAIPAYQDYVAKSKFAAALGEVSSGKTAFDVALNDGNTPGTAPADLAGMGLATTATANCLLSATSTTLKCVVQGGPQTVQGKDILLTRDSAGQWACTTTVLAASQVKLIGPVGVCKATG